MVQEKLFQSKRAFSMVEVIVAAVLFAIASAGIFATISYTNRSVESDKRVQAATFSKKILDQLNKDVNALTWDIVGSNGLTIGNHPIALGSDSDFPQCFGGYDVTDPDGNGGRKVLITIDCP
jgi:prepilin-type N-terminal cleavage/methylation domain-containing protein